ncbi:hypothetical protein N9595_04835, partial [Bacteroidia bacterium]|nr:hypothetical protein [Bacteroidia bacterium]
AKNNECSDCDSVDVKYSKQVSSILGTSCVTCHNATSASAGVKLHDYASVKNYVDNGKLNGSINHLTGYKSMPPTGMLDACNLAIIKKWIDEGAQNN